MMRHADRTKQKIEIRAANGCMDLLRCFVDGRRVGFTLIELLVAIGIIGFMASMVVFTMAGAQTDAKIARTEATIQKLNTIIMEKWESYRYRAVDLGVGHYYSRRGIGGVAPITGQTAAAFRLYMLRDIMRMELPDSSFDIEMPTSFAMKDYKTNGDIYVKGTSTILNSTTPHTATAMNLRSYLSSASSANFRAECLYGIIANSSTDGVPAIELFKPSEIADTDSDGLPEFIDAWGNPIGFIRWPVAYESQLQSTYRSVPDAFDPLRLDRFWEVGSSTPGEFPWTVIPLIFSFGPDADPGMAASAINFKAIGASLPLYSPFEYGPPASPYTPNISYFNPTVGAIDNPAAAADNITNHDLMVRQY